MMVVVLKNDDDDDDDDGDDDDDDDDDDDNGDVVFIVSGSAQQICLGWPSPLLASDIRNFLQELHVVSDGVSSENDLPWLQQFSHHTPWCGFLFKISSGWKVMMACYANS